MFFRKKKSSAVSSKPKKNWGGLITGLIVGGAVGSVLSLLFAPDSGANTRRKLLSRGKEALSEGKTKAEAFLEKYKKK